MAVDMFLKIEGISGDSQAKGHENEIDLQSYSFGVSQIANVHGAGGGAGAGKASFQDIHFGASSSSASPQLFKVCATGQHIKKAVLHVRKAGGEQQDFYVVTMSDVLVSGYSNGSNPLDDGFSLRRSDDAFPTDQFSLNFKKVEIAYIAQKPTGETGPSVSSDDQSVG